MIVTKRMKAVQVRESRFHNRRARGILLSDNSVQFQYRRLVYDGINGRCVSHNGVRLSPEAASATAEMIIRFAAHTLNITPEALVRKWFPAKRGKKAAK